MSIVKNKALLGLTTQQFNDSPDESSSVVIWKDVTIGSTTYTFCEFITTNETGNPTYIRDVPHLGIVRPTGHDYYPCHNGTTYGVYDKINHTFTPKTVIAHGEEDQPYGVGIYDLMWATASGYTDLLMLAAADGGRMASDAVNPIVISNGTTTLNLAFNVKDIALPQGWSIISSVNENISNGDLLYGRKPLWKIFADNAPICTLIRTINNEHEIIVSCLDAQGRAGLQWWNGYNASSVRPPMIECSTPTWELEYHNGVYTKCADELTTYIKSISTFESDKQYRLWRYDASATDLPEIHLAVGNLVDWFGKDINEYNPANRVNILGFYGTIQMDAAYVSFPLTLIKTLPFWNDGSQAATYPANAGYFSHLSSASVISKARDGKYNDVFFNFAANGGIVNNAVANAMYTMFSYPVYADGLTAEHHLMLIASGQSGEFDTEAKHYATPVPFVLTKKNEGVGTFRMMVKTPTVTFGSNTYNIINGVWANWYSGDDQNSPHRFVFREKSSTNYIHNGIGMTFLYESVVRDVNNNIVSDTVIEATSANKCICSLELTTCDSTGKVIAYTVLAKHRSKGIYYVGEDPDVEYKNSAWTYTSNATFAPDVLCAAKLTNGQSASSPDDNFILNYTQKIGFFYENDIPIAFCDRENKYNEFVGSYHETMIKPHTTAIIGFYGDRNILTTYDNTLANLSIPISWWLNPYDDLDERSGGGTYNQSTPFFHEGFRGWPLLTTDSQKIFVYPYENSIRNGNTSTNAYTDIFFKRFKLNGSYYITDMAATPNVSINDVYSETTAGGVTTRNCKYVLMVQYTAEDGAVYNGGAAFVATGQTNQWELLCKGDGVDSDSYAISLPNGVSIYAQLDYIQDTSSLQKFFEMPQGLAGIQGALTTFGMFRLRLWSYKASGAPLLGVFRWSIQDV